MIEVAINHPKDMDQSFLEVGIQMLSIVCSTTGTYRHGYSVNQTHFTKGRYWASIFQSPCALIPLQAMAIGSDGNIGNSI